MILVIKKIFEDLKVYGSKKYCFNFQTVVSAALRSSVASISSYFEQTIALWLLNDFSSYFYVI